MARSAREVSRRPIQMGRVTRAMHRTARRRPQDGPITHRRSWTLASVSDPSEPPLSMRYSTCPSLGSAVNYSLPPGEYNCQLKINGATVTMSSGLYVFDQGVSMSSGVLDGTAGVLMYFPCKTADPWAPACNESFSQSNGTINMNPYATGPPRVPRLVVLAERRRHGTGHAGWPIDRNFAERDDVPRRCAGENHGRHRHNNGRPDHRGVGEHVQRNDDGMPGGFRVLKVDTEVRPMPRGLPLGGCSQFCLRSQVAIPVRVRRVYEFVRSFCLEPSTRFPRASS